MSPLSILTNQVGSERQAQHLMAELAAKGYLIVHRDILNRTTESLQEFEGDVSQQKVGGVSQQQKVEGYINSNDIVSAITLGGVSIDACDDHLGKWRYIDN